MGTRVPVHPTLPYQVGCSRQATKVLPSIQSPLSLFCSCRQIVKINESCLPAWKSCLP